MFTLGLAGLGVFLFRSLPSPAAIAQALKHDSSDRTVTDATKVPSEAQAPVSDQLTSGAELANTENTKSDLSQTSQQEKADQVIKEFLKEDIRDLQICRNLGSSRLLDSQRGKTAEEKQKLEFDKVFTEEAKTDSFAESLRYPLKVILQDDSLKPLFDEVFAIEKDLPENAAEKESFLKKIGFYSRVTAAMAGLYAKKENFEYIANRSHHLGVLAKLAHLKPELRSDPRVYNACDRMAQSLTQGEIVDIVEEREEILELIRDSGLTPEQLEFDPASFIQFKINSSDKGINFSLTDQEKPN